MMRRVVEVCLALALMSFLSLPLLGSVITIDASQRGWIQNEGTANTPGPLANYLAGWCAPGDCGGFEYRNFFVFSIPSLSGSVISAQLLINTSDILSPDSTETYQVTSIPVSFVYADLGTGTLYGSRTYTVATDSMQVLGITLNTAALSAIVSGSTVRVGGRVTTLSGQTAQDELVFGSSIGSGNVSRLEITTTDVIPEPSTWLLSGCGLLVAGALKRFRMP